MGSIVGPMGFIAGMGIGLAAFGINRLLGSMDDSNSRVAAVEI